MKFILPILCLLGMAAIILAGYWYESCQWRYCKSCRKFWHLKTGRKQDGLPKDSDGIVKPKTCKECEQ